MEIVNLGRHLKCPYCTRPAVITMNELSYEKGLDSEGNQVIRVFYCQYCKAILQILPA